MYAKRLSVYDFRCFGKAVLDLQYPGRPAKGASEIDNVNLILGDNGGGKSSVLRAVAIAVLAPALLESGFVAYRLVRRPGPKTALLKVDAVLDETEYQGDTGKNPRTLEMLARFEARDKQSRDRLHLESTPSSPITERIFDDFSPAFFMVGYGATRRVETSEYSESHARRSRGLRYQRVAGLFEDHVPLRPLQNWLPRLEGAVRRQALDVINAVLPPNVRFDGEFDRADDQFIFRFGERATPFSALSDGYKAFVGMAGDLLGHLADVCPDGMRLDQISGIVLIDEIDLHLHPAWQRTVLPSLARAFPRLQFICTTHSPLVASAVRRENVFVTDDGPDGTATIKQLEERVFGQSAEQLLLSSYFGLKSTRSDAFNNEADLLMANAADGDKTAALAFLDKLAAPIQKIERTLSATGRSKAPTRRTRKPAAKPSKRA